MSIYTHYCRYFTPWKRATLEDHILPKILRTASGQEKVPFGVGAVATIDVSGLEWALGSAALLLMNDDSYHYYFLPPPLYRPPLPQKLVKSFGHHEVLMSNNFLEV